MQQETKSKKRLPYWLALVIGTLGTFIVMNLIAVLLQVGAFNSWESFQVPPSKVAKIISVDYAYNEIWVETNDGKIFSTNFPCRKDEVCPQWKPVDKLQDIPEAQFPITRGSNCQSLKDNVFPLDPNGKTIECIYSNVPGTEMGKEVYLALMTDSTLRYWENVGSIATQIFFVLSTFVVPFFVAILISGIYLFQNIIKRVSHDSDEIRDGQT